MVRPISMRHAYALVPTKGLALMKHKAPWTEAHRREALTRLYELAAEWARSGCTSVACSCVTDHAHHVRQGLEGDFRRALAAAECDAARIDREVRRVHGLVEGWLVREMTLHVRFVDGGLSCALEDHDSARRWSHSIAATGAIVRVKRIRAAA